MREGWETTPLSDLLRRRSDRLGDAEEPQILTVTEGNGLVDQIDRWGRRMATSDVGKYKIVDPGDIVYNVYLLWNGAIGQNLFDAPGVTSPVYEVFSPGVNVDPRFLGLVVSSPKMLRIYDTISIGTIPRRRRAPWRDFLRIPIALPPLHEQRRIVDLIGSLDETIEAAESERRAMGQLWWSLAHALEESAASYSKVSLGEISDIHSGLTKNKKDAERADAVEAPYLRVANVQRNRIILDDLTTIVAARPRIEKAQLLAGDLLMTEGGDRDKLGRGGVWRGEINGCTHQNHVFRVRVTDPGIVPEFVSIWSNSFGRTWFDMNAAQTTGIASISKSTLSRFPVPTVPFSTQQHWVELFNQVLALEDRSADSAARLRELRSNLITALLSGEHEIPADYDELLDDRDVSASVLEGATS